MVSSLPTLAAVVAVLVVVNLLNHRWRQHWYVRTCVVAAVVMVLIGRVSGLSWSQMGLGRSFLLSGLLWGPATIAVVALVYSVGVSVPWARRFLVDDRLSGRPGFAVARHALVEVPFGTVLLEEVAFRGVLYADVADASGTVTAVIVSSALFGVWHVLPALAWHESNAGIAETLGERHGSSRWFVVGLSVVVTAAGGVLFCLLRIVSGSLLAPMALHWAINGLALFLVWWVLRKGLR